MKAGDAVIAQLDAQVDGIDILLSGHTHNRIHQPVQVNGATIIQSGCHASFIGRLDVELAPGRDWAYELPDGHNAFAYVFEGALTLGNGEAAREM